MIGGLIVDVIYCFGYIFGYVIFYYLDFNFV